MSTTVGAFVAAGWPRHPAEPGAVFEEGRALVGQLDEAGDLLPLGRLLFHVGADHLGRYAEAVDVLAALRARPACAAGSADERGLWRFTAAAHLCAAATGGDGSHARAAQEAEERAHAGNDLPRASERGAIQALAAAALVGQRRTAEAAHLFAEALASASYGPQRSDPLSRALAVTGNNLATELAERTDRTAAEDSLMLQAAQTARRFWEVAGDWIHVERAEYRLALTYVALGDGERAQHHARNAVAACAEHGADDMERFFAHEALARALLAAGDRAAAQAARTTAASHLAAIADASTQSYCAAELAKLDHVLAGHAKTP